MAVWMRKALFGDRIRVTNTAPLPDQHIRSRIQRRQPRKKMREKKMESGK